MKVMESCPGQGASRREGWASSQGLQRRHGCEDAFSCFDIFGLQYQSLLFLEHRCAGHVAAGNVFGVSQANQAAGRTNEHAFQIPGTGK